MNETISKREEILEELVPLRKALAEAWRMQEESFTVFRDRSLPIQSFMEAQISILTEESIRIRRMLELSESLPNYVADEPIMTTLPPRKGFFRLLKTRTPVQTIIVPEDFTTQANFQAMRMRQMLEDVSKSIVSRRRFLEHASLLVKTSVVMAEEITAASNPSFVRQRLTAERLASAVDANATSSILWQRRFETLLARFQPQTSGVDPDSDDPSLNLDDETA